MPDNYKRAGMPDPLRINIHEEHEIRYWSHKLNVTPDRLLDAVHKVGPLATDVARELAG